MTTFLTVPFAEKEQAKALGARWNAERKKWYVPAGTELTAFKKWLGDASTKQAVPSGALAVEGVPQMEHIGLTIAGTNYVKTTHHCVPWLPCDQCDV